MFLSRSSAPYLWISISQEVVQLPGPYYVRTITSLHSWRLSTIHAPSKLLGRGTNEFKVVFNCSYSSRRTYIGWMLPYPRRRRDCRRGAEQDQFGSEHRDQASRCNRD